MKFKKQMFVSRSNENYFIEKIIYMVKLFFKTLLFNIFGFIFFSFSILKYFLIQYKILILADFSNFHFGNAENNHLSLWWQPSDSMKLRYI